MLFLSFFPVFVSNLCRQKRLCARVNLNSLRTRKTKVRVLDECVVYSISKKQNADKKRNKNSMDSGASLVLTQSLHFLC